MVTFDVGTRHPAQPAARARFHEKAAAHAGRVRVRQVLNQNSAPIQRQPPAPSERGSGETPQSLAQALRDALRGWATDEIGRVHV